MKNKIIVLFSIVILSLCMLACVPHEHIHTFSSLWDNDRDNHWHNAVCEHKEERSDFAKHDYKNGVCKVCDYVLYNVEDVLKEINPEEMHFGGKYNLNLPDGIGIELNVWSEDKETKLDGVLKLNDDMSLEVIGIARRGYFNFSYAGEYIYAENIFFNIKTEQLTEKIRSVLKNSGISGDIITSNELSLIKELNLSELFLNNADAFAGLKYLTSLKSLDLSNNNLNNDDITVLAGMTDLSKLNLSNNRISDISILKNNINIKELDLSYNLLNTVDDYNSINALNRLGKLTTLNLEHNSIKNITPISNLTELICLNLNHNRITSASIDSIVGLTALQEISLGYNKDLSDLTAFYSLQYIENLLYVDLSGINLHQQFTVGESTRFPISDKLQTLKVSGSGLADTDLSDIAHKFNNLLTIDLSENELLSEAGLNKYFKEAVKLENLDISYLKIKALPDILSLKNLKSLSFNDCYNLYNIESLYSGTFAKLESLSFDNCNSIKFSEDYTVHGIDEIVAKMPSLNNLSIVDGIHWLNSSMYEYLQNMIATSPDEAGSANPNNLSITLFEGEKVSYDNIVNYPRVIYFSVSELSKASVLKDNMYHLKYSDGKYKCVLSLVNDYAAKNSKITIAIPSDFFEFSIYGIVNEQYPISVNVLDRKRAALDIVLDNCILKGNGAHVFNTANESIVTFHAKGERVEIKPGEMCHSVLGYDIKLKCDTEKPFIMMGGTGYKGADGLSSPTSKQIHYTQRKGYKGGTGLSAIHCNSLEIYEDNSDNIKIIGGKGGLGGKGGDAGAKGEWTLSADHLSGGPGGDGGDGGPAVAYVNSIKLCSAVLNGGDPGEPGSIGNPDKTNNLYDGVYYYVAGSPGSKGVTILQVES